MFMPALFWGWMELWKEIRAVDEPWVLESVMRQAASDYSKCSSMMRDMLGP